MGTKVDAQINHSHPYVAAVQRMNELSFLYSRMPLLWISPVWYALGYGNEYDHNLQLVTNFTRQVIADRRRKLHHQHLTETIPNLLDTKTESLKKKAAFLDLLLGVEDEGKLTDEDIREEVDTFM
uniref:Cytochrome P450 n=1 Tax=Ditylenchus dipsaci TaxID=166011 RepID=A0A915E7K4_9BILA